MKKKLLLIMPLFPEKGGISTYSHNLLSSFATSKLDIHCATTGDTNFINHNIHMHKLDAHDPFSFFISFFKIFLRGRFDVVHFQMSLSKEPYKGAIGEVYLLIFILLRLIKTKIIITSHDNADLIEINKRVANHVTVLKTFFAYLFYLFNKLIYTAVDIIVVHSRYEFEIIRGYGVPSDKIVNIPHGINITTPVDQDLAKKTLGISKKMILGFGYITPEKGLEYLVEAMKYVHSDSVLYIVGELDNKWLTYYDKLICLSRAYSITDRVIIWPKYVSSYEKDLLFSAADLIVVPYVSMIGTSGVIMDAISYGKTILTSDLAPFLEIMAQIDKNAMFPATNVIALSSKLNAYLSNPKKYASQKKTMVDQLCWSNIAKKHLNLYSSL